MVRRNSGPAYDYLSTLTKQALSPRRPQTLMLRLHQEMVLQQPQATTPWVTPTEYALATSSDDAPAPTIPGNHVISTTTISINTNATTTTAINTTTTIST